MGLTLIMIFFNFCCNFLRKNGLKSWIHYDTILNFNDWVSMIGPTYSLLHGILTVFNKFLSIFLLNLLWWPVVGCTDGIVYATHHICVVESWFYDMYWYLEWFHLPSENKSLQESIFIFRQILKFWKLTRVVIFKA